MACRAKATLNMLVKIGDKNRQDRVEKVGNGRYVSKVKGPFEPGPYYLHYPQDGKRP